MQPFKFPENFRLGTATAALQIEGGDRNNNWYRWSELGKIEDGSHSVVACDHWERVEEDIALMKQLNCQVYRMGVEWSRIEPRQGEYDKDALAHYRREIELLLEADIQPLVTLHHFSHPLWMEDAGAWTNPEVLSWFENFTRVVVEALGDLVAEWTTINEPNVYLTMGYILGTWPPGIENNKPLYFKGAENMIAGHIKAYKLIHQMRREMGFQDTKVGVANHLRIFDPINNSPLSKFSSWLHGHLFQEVFLEGMSLGQIRFPLKKHPSITPGKYLDFLGVNYYSRDIIKGKLNPNTLFGELSVRKGAAVNDLGWEIYPEGIYRICEKYYRRYQVPIYITENGTCDSADDFRAKYTYDHLAELHRAIKDGIDIQRYYHWTLMDNFEWVEGISARFGLIAVNFETQERKIRKSGLFFADICRNGGVTDKAITTYLSGG